MMGCTELRVLGDFVNLLKSDHVIQSLILKTHFRLNVIQYEICVKLLKLTCNQT